MVLFYLFAVILVIIATYKVFNSWKLAAEIQGKQPAWYVRAFFGFFDLVSDTLGMQVFK